MQKHNNMTANPELFMRCLQVEALVRIMVMKGINDNEALVAAVDASFCPETEEEQELYSEAIIYAKRGVLN
jgi:hypothetical protein